MFFVFCHNCRGIWLILVLFVEVQESMRSFGVFSRRSVVAYGQLQEDAVGFLVRFVLVAVWGVSLLNRRLEKAERLNVDLRRVFLDKIVVWHNVWSLQRGIVWFEWLAHFFLQRLNYKHWSLGIFEFLNLHFFCFNVNVAVSLDEFLRKWIWLWHRHCLLVC